MGTVVDSLPAMNPRVLNLGHKLNGAQQLGLIAPVTKEEVHLVLKDIGDGNAPGVDGILFQKNTTYYGRRDH